MLAPKRPSAALLAEIQKAEDAANGGLRREPELPDHVAIVKETESTAPRGIRGHRRQAEGQCPSGSNVIINRCAVSRGKRRSIPATDLDCKGPPMRDRMNVYFPPELLKEIADLAARKGLSRSSIVEAAVASFLVAGWRGPSRGRLRPASRPDVAASPAARTQYRHFDRDAGSVHPLLADHHATSRERCPRRSPSKRPGAL